MSEASTKERERERDKESYGEAKERKRTGKEEVAWRPCRQPRASLTAVESMRFPSLRVVNNGDGDDNEAIYRHTLAHVLTSTFAFPI